MEEKKYQKYKNKIITRINKKQKSSIIKLRTIYTSGQEEEYGQNNKKKQRIKNENIKTIYPI